MVVVVYLVIDHNIERSSIPFFSLFFWVGGLVDEGYKLSRVKIKF